QLGSAVDRRPAPSGSAKTALPCHWGRQQLPGAHYCCTDPLDCLLVAHGGVPRLRKRERPEDQRTKQKEQRGRLDLVRDEAGPLGIAEGGDDLVDVVLRQLRLARTGPRSVLESLPEEQPQPPRVHRVVVEYPSKGAPDVRGIEGDGLGELARPPSDH